MTNKFLSLAVFDIYWLWIPIQPHSFRWSLNLCGIIFVIYCFISNHPVMESIIVTAFNIKVFFIFIRKFLGLIRSMQSLFQGIFPYNLKGKFTGGFVGRFVHCNVPQLLPYLWLESCIPGRYKFCWILASVQFFTGRRRYAWYRLSIYLYIFYVITSLSFYTTSFLVFWTPWNETFYILSMWFFPVFRGVSVDISVLF